jgi:hypothetical protein
MTLSPALNRRGDLLVSPNRRQSAPRCSHHQDAHRTLMKVSSPERAKAFDASAVANRATHMLRPRRWIDWPAVSTATSLRCRLRDVSTRSHAMTKFTLLSRSESFSLARSIFLAATDALRCPDTCPSRLCLYSQMEVVNRSMGTSWLLAALRAGRQMCSPGRARRCRPAVRVAVVMYGEQVT